MDNNGNENYRPSCQMVFAFMIVLVLVIALAVILSNTQIDTGAVIQFR